MSWVGGTSWASQSEGLHYSNEAPVPPMKTSRLASRHIPPHLCDLLAQASVGAALFLPISSLLSLLQVLPMPVYTTHPRCLFQHPVLPRLSAQDSPAYIFTPKLLHFPPAHLCLDIPKAPPSQWVWSVSHICFPPLSTAPQLAAPTDLSSSNLWPSLFFICFE